MSDSLKPTVDPEHSVTEPGELRDQRERSATIPESVGPYLVQGVISSGGMGDVLIGFDPRLERSVAIKRIRGEVDDARRARFLREARLQAVLDHAGIVRVYDIRRAAGIDYIVSEYVEGTSLETLAFGGASATGLPIPDALRIAMELAEVLEYAHHMGVIHRDIKLENVIIALDGSAKLTDFGISHAAFEFAKDAPGSASPGSSMFETAVGRQTGTPRSMSPEQSRGEPTDERSDWFSFGVLLYELLCGQSPFVGADLASTLHNIQARVQVPLVERRAAVPPEISALVDQLLEKQPANRATATTVRTTLQRIAAGFGDLDSARRSVEITQRQLAVGVLRAEFDDKGLLRSGSANRVATLLELHDSIAAAVTEVGGSLLLFVGNQVGFCVGHPLCHDNNCERAAQLMLDIRDAVGERHANVRLAGALTLGSASVVQRGNKARILGQTVDDALSLCSAAHAGQLAISPAARGVLTRKFEIELSSVMHALTSERTIPLSLLRRARAGAGDGDDEALPLIAREQHLHTLERAWSSARAGAGQALLLTAEAGLGKTRLVTAWLATLDAGDAAASVRLVNSTPERQYDAFGLIRSLVAAELGLDTSVSVDALEQALARFELGLEQARAVEILSLLFDLDRQPSHELRGESRRSAFLDQLVALLLAMFGRAPSIVVVEDLHWADHSSLSVLQLLAAQRQAAPMLLLMTGRPDAADAWTSKDRVEHVDLSRLDGPQAKQLVESILGATQLPTRMIHTIVEQAEGIPLLLEEFARALVGHGARQADGHGDDWSVADIPTSLRDSVHRRLDGLGPVRRSLECLAILGRQAPPALLAALTRLEPERLTTQLHEAERVGLLTKQRWFRHALVHNAVEASLDDERRVELHRRVVALLGGEHRALVDAHPEAYVRHYELTGELERGFELRVAAGTRALQRLAYVEASRHLRAALELLALRPATPERAELERGLLRMLGPVEIAVNGWSAPPVLELYARAKQLDDERGIAPGGAELFGRYVGGLVVHDVAGVNEVLALIDESATTPETRFLRGLARGTAACHRGEIVDARRHLRGACALVLESLDGQRAPEDTLDFSIVQQWSEEVLIAPFSYLGVIEAYRGDFEASDFYQAKAEQIARDRNALYAETYALGCAVVIGIIRHDPGYCGRIADKLEPLLSSGAPWLGFARALYDIARGHASTNATEFGRGIRAFREMGIKATLECHAAACAEVCRKLGDLDAAQEYLELALELGAHEFSRIHASEVNLAAARVYRARGDHARADAHVEAARAAYALMDDGDEPLVRIQQYIAAEQSASSPS